MFIMLKYNLIPSFHSLLEASSSYPICSTKLLYLNTLIDTACLLLRLLEAPSFSAAFSLCCLCSNSHGPLARSNPIPGLCCAWAAEWLFWCLHEGSMTPWHLPLLHLYRTSERPQAEWYRMITPSFLLLQKCSTEKTVHFWLASCLPLLCFLIGYNTCQLQFVVKTSKFFSAFQRVEWCLGSSNHLVKVPKCFLLLRSDFGCWGSLSIWLLSREGAVQVRVSPNQL